VTLVPQDQSMLKQNGIQAGKKKVLIISLVVLVLLTIGGIAFSLKYLPVKKYLGIKALAANKEEVTQTVEMGSMTVKLADSNEAHYLRVNPILEFKADKKLEEEISKKNYLIRDSFLKVMRSKFMSDIQSVQGSEALKAQFLEVINKHLKSGRIKRIYYIEFLVQ